MVGSLIQLPATDYRGKINGIVVEAGIDRNDGEIIHKIKWLACKTFPEGSINWIDLMKLINYNDIKVLVKVEG